MKKTILIIVVFVALTGTIVHAQTKEFLKVEKINGYENFYKSGDFYFAGQPNLEAFKWLKQEGVKTIINLRSNDENKEFEKLAFSEDEMAKELEFKYITIPMKGKDAFNPKTLKAFTDAVEAAEGKVLVHCKAAGRVTLVMMAYLIESKGYTMEEAETFGKQVTYFSALDGLLGK